jgi:hypothetical protein
VLTVRRKPVLVACVSASQELKEVLSCRGNIHASEFEEGQLNAFPDSIPELGAPAGTALGSKMVMLLVFWSNGVA